MWLRWKTLKKTGRKHAYLAWRDENGRERTEALRTTDERVAAAILRRRQLEAGEIPAPAVGPAEDLLEQFLAEKALQVRPGTVEQFREKLGPLFAAWRDVPLHLWERRMWIEYVGAHPDWSPRTTELVYQKLRAFLAWARDLDLPVADVLAGYKPPRPRPQERDHLSPEQEQALMDAVRGHRYLEPPVALALYAGLSRADFRALQWPQVDLDAGTITLRRSKTGQRVEVPVCPALDEVLRRARALGGPVCRGLPESNGSLHKALHRLCDRAKIPRGGWHRFRHTFATRLIASGADLKTVARLVGHAHGSTATLLYVQGDRARERRAIDRAFGGLP